MLKYDGHVHTPFCPHGSPDSLEAYVEQALSLGLRGLTFTEHAPLPENFVDPTPLQDCGMKKDQLPIYIQTLKELKETYANKITINIGLEIDYIEGFEEGTRELLATWGSELDDAILSVHFLKIDDTYYCLDYSPETFADIIKHAGSIHKVYETYFHTVKKAIKAELGIYKPRRIGHLTLIRKFQKRFPNDKQYTSTILELLDLIKEKRYMLDYNGAGFSKPLCQEPYPPYWIVNEAVKRNIPLIYGSDAHSVKGMAQGFHRLYLNHMTIDPTTLYR